MKNTLYFALAVVLALLSSCEKETVLTVDQTMLSFTDAGGSQTVTLTANKEWKADASQSWCHVFPAGSQEAVGREITISCDPNAVYGERTCSVTFTCAEATVVVGVTQASGNGIVMDGTSYELTRSAQQLEIKVAPNLAFSVEVAAGCEEWIAYSETASAVLLDIAENDTYDSREGQVTVRQEGGPLSSTISIRQAQLDGLFIDQSVHDVAGEGGSVIFSLSANVDYTVEPQADWIQVFQTKGLKTQQIALVIAANETPEPREGTVLVRQNNGELNGSVLIRQKSVLQKERDALIAFYNLMNGPNWTRSDNWCSDLPLDQWYGIHSTTEWTTYARDGHVRDIFLAGLGVSGDLAKAVDILRDLPYLEDFNLQINPLRQPIPANLQHLKNLRRISLWECQLTGTIPPELGNLKNLEHLEIQENPELTGPIPASLGNLSEAKWINVSLCNLTGNVPVEITHLNKLAFPFDCWGNPQMSGVVPAEFADWQYWTDFWGHIVHGTHLQLDEAIPHIPDFSVTLIDGETVTADVVKDQKLTILFQWATWCGFSAQFLPLLRSAYKQFAKDGLYVLSWADKDEPADKVLQYMSDNGVIWPTFLADEVTNKIKGDLLPRSDRNAFYPFSGFPSINAFDSDGKLVYTNANSNQMESFVPFMQEWFGNSDWDGQDETLYQSTDYSQDGIVTTVQEATEGRGIDIVITGDAFSDRLIADGTFMKEVNRVVGAFFSREPYRSMRQYFNVYVVNAVSQTEVVHDETAFHTYWRGGNPNILGGDNWRVMEYARKAIPDERMDDAVIIVLMNLDMNAGTCHLFDCPGGDYGRGVTVSYIPTYSQGSRFQDITVHEAGGHGFAKLADEYSTSQGAIPEDVVDSYRSAFAFGWWKNIDFTDDPSAVKWAPFIGNSHFASEEIGVYQGGVYYDWGVYRPTYYSLMFGGGSFNAPSRQAIWYRINKLAWGEQWNGTFEDFVAFDKAPSSSSAAPRPNCVEKQEETRLAQPVIHPCSWRELETRDR